MHRVVRIAVLAVIGTLIGATLRYRALVADQPPAPELASKAGWLNTDRPLRLSDELKGHVVVLDFWTYCCINCMHILPDLKYLEEKYKDEPVVVIGVHSAKFNNESERESIRNAIFRYGIHHPVVIDSNMSLWNAYGIPAWPSFVVIGTDGRLTPIQNRLGTPLFVASGEGKREVLDAAIAAALKAGRADGTIASKRVTIIADASVPSMSGLSFPGKVIGSPPTDAAPGHVFIADSSHNRVLVTTWPRVEGGRAVSTLEWTIGGVEAGLVDGDGAHARFHDPQGMSYDPSKHILYVADTDNHVIRAVGIPGAGAGSGAPTVHTILGSGEQVNDREGGRAGKEQGISSPWDVALSPDHSLLYIAMAGLHQIWRMDLGTGVATAFAGSGREDILDGPAAEASLAQTSALSFTPDGSRLYFADSETSSIRWVDMKDDTVHTVVGHGLFDFGDVSNTFERSRFQHCLGVAVWPRANDGRNHLIVADTYNHKVKLIDLKGERVSELFGVGRMEDAKSAGDLVLDEPGGVSLVQDARGEPALFVADTNNHRVLFANPATGEWHELVIDGLSGDAPEENAGRALAATVQAAPGKDLKLLVSPALAPGASPNPEAPISISVRLNDGRETRTVAQRTVRAAAFPVSVTVPGEVVRDGALLRVSASYAACTHDEFGVCLPGSAAWDVTVHAGQAVEAELKGE